MVLTTLLRSLLAAFRIAVMLAKTASWLIVSCGSSIIYWMKAHSEFFDGSRDNVAILVGRDVA